MGIYISGRIYNRSKVFIHQTFLKVVVHAIIINQNEIKTRARLYKIQATAGYSLCDVRVRCKEGYL